MTEYWKQKNRGSDQRVKPPISEPSVKRCDWFVFRLIRPWALSGFSGSTQRLSHWGSRSCDGPVHSYQLLHSFSRGPRGVVVSDQQHLLEVLVRRRAGLGRLREVFTLRTTAPVIFQQTPSLRRDLIQSLVLFVPAAGGSLGGRPTVDKSLRCRCRGGLWGPRTDAYRC